MARVAILPPTAPIEIDRVDLERAGWVHHSVEEDNHGPCIAVMKSHCYQNPCLNAQRDIQKEGSQGVFPADPRGGTFL